MVSGARALAKEQAEPLNMSQIQTVLDVISATPKAEADDLQDLVF